MSCIMRMDLVVVDIECENLEVQPLNLNVNLNIAYEKVNVQGKNLNIARGKLNGESVTQMSNNKCRIKCKKLNIKCNMERHKNGTILYFSDNLAKFHAAER